VKPIRVLLADDQQLLRTGFKMVLGTEPDLDIVGEATDGVEAVEMARRLLPDVVLMDVRMPRRDGVAATRERGHRRVGPRADELALEIECVDDVFTDRELGEIACALLA